MSNDTPSSLFSPEVADLFRQASARQDAINNEAAARMYAAIHRGERDIRLLEDIADPLSDAEYAGEEHYRNLIHYVATFNPTEAFRMQDFFEEVNGFKNHIVYALIRLLRTLYTPEQFASDIIPLLKTRGDWRELTVLLLAKAVSDSKLHWYEAQQLLLPHVDELANDHDLLWQMVDEFDEHWLPLPNETYHPLTTREWTDINEATCQVSSCYFAHSLLTARVRILQLEAEGQTYETSEEYRTMIDFIRKEHDKQDTLRKQHLPHFTADQPQVAPTYIRFWGFWSPEGSSHAPREQYSMLIVPIAQISQIIEDDQYSRIIPLGINYDLGIHPNSHWICEGNIEFIRE